MINAWSFSRLNVYEECPHRAFLQFVEKHPVPTNEYAEHGIEVHQHIEDYLTGKHNKLNQKFPNPHYDLIVAMRDNPSLEVEQMWCFNRHWEPVASDDFNNTWLRIKCDAVTLDPPEAVKIYDWKTGQKATAKTVTYALQQQLYAIGAFSRYPGLAIVETNIHWVESQAKPIQATFTRERAELYRIRWQARAEVMFNDNEFVAKPNKFNCRFCPFAPNAGNQCLFGVELN